MFTHGVLVQSVRARMLQHSLILILACNCSPRVVLHYRNLHNALQCEVNCRDTCQILYSAYNTQDIDLCCVTLAMFSFAVYIFLT